MANHKDVPTIKPTTKARGGVTGHNVRYVLAFGLGGVIIAFLIIGPLLLWCAVLARLRVPTSPDYRCRLNKIRELIARCANGTLECVPTLEV